MILLACVASICSREASASFVAPTAYIIATGTDEPDGGTPSTREQEQACGNVSDSAISNPMDSREYIALITCKDC
jgi:hypothetical protein